MGILENFFGKGESNQGNLPPMKIPELKKPGLTEDASVILSAVRVMQISQQLPGDVFTLDEVKYSEKELPFIIENFATHLYETYPKVFLGQGEAEEYVRAVLEEKRNFQGTLN